jgi:hypothetical protein
MTTAASSANRRRQALREAAAAMGAAGGRAGKGTKRPYAAANLARARAKRWPKVTKDLHEHTKDTPA